METKTSKAKIKGNHMLWVIRWIRLGSAQNSKHASAQLSAIWREERGGKSWTLLCFMLIPLRSNIAPPPTPAGLLSMTCDDHEDILFWNESISPAQVTLSVCVCLCVSVHGCVSRSQGGWVRCLAGGVVVDTASLLQCHLSLLSYLLLWQRRTYATWSTSAPRLIGPLLVYQVSPGNLFRHTCLLI